MPDDECLNNVEALSTNAEEPFVIRHLSIRHSLDIRHSSFVICNILLTAAVLCSTAFAQGELAVRDVLWGFDGQVRPHRFNPVSIQIDNASSEPFEGTLRLIKSVGGKEVGAPLEESVFVSPHTRQWVKFYPFVKRDWEIWTLVWDDGRQRFELPQPPLPTEADFDVPTTVLLSDTQALTQAGGSAKRFPDELFPPVVTATDGLDVVLLDHVPRWPEGPREAFLDWLARGGTVHLLLGPDREFPTFPQSMAVLNTPADRFHVGAGIVFRRRISRGEISRDFIDNTVLLETASRIRPPKEELEELERALARDVYFGTPDLMWFDDFSYGILHDLRSKTIPRHHWALIYPLAILYVMLIFPCAYLLGRRRLAVPVVYGALLGVIAVFSVALGLLGRRGHSESNAVHTIAMARQLPGGQWDVTGWSNAFVTEGDRYRIDHQGHGGLYSTAQEAEFVRGAIRGGQDGFFDAEIPPFSSRTFAHRVKTAAGPEFTFESWRAGAGGMTELVVSTSGLPDQVLTAYALYGRDIYRMRSENGRLVLQPGGARLSGFLGALNDERFWHYAFPDIWAEQRPVEEELDARMIVPLVAQSLEVESRRKAERFRLPPDRVRLFVYAPLPEEFFVKDERLRPQTGSVLYSVDLFPANPE